ncbi:MAG: hypothetical protein WA104_00530, partial [Thermodesulfovibrionales bacterium]
DLIMNLGNFLFEYNHLRKHGGLNYMTPFDKLEKVTELVSENNSPESTASPVILGQSPVKAWMGRGL